MSRFKDTTTADDLIQAAADSPQVAAAATAALDTWAGSGNVTTVGTITTGTWAGTPIGVGAGGTGITSYTTGDIIFASSPSTLAALPAGTINFVLTSNGPGTAPSWQTPGAGGVGDVVGPASAVNNRVVFFDGTTGKLIKDSGLTLSGSNTGDQTITLTGDVTGSGTGSFAATIGNGAVTLPKIAGITANTILGNNTGGPQSPISLTATQVRTMLNVADGATANQTDAFLLARGNHTGTQAFSTITATPTTLAGYGITDAAPSSHVGAGGAAHAAATTSVAGFMSAADKTKLDGAAVLSGATFTGKVNTVASATGNAGFNVPHGTAPTSPLNGDMWTTTTDMLVRINGVTRTNAWTDSNITGSAATLTTGRTISTTGDVTYTSGAFNGSANVTGTATIANGVVTLAKMNNLAANSIIGNNTGGATTPLALTAAQVRTLINVADGATANAGTVTSVAVANATGITWTGSPITSSGTLTPTLSTNLQAWSGIATTAKEDAFSKGDLIAGTNVSFSGSGVGRLVGTGNLTINATGGGGGGDVTGPASAGDARIATFNGTTGKIIQDGGSTVADVLARANHTGTQAISTVTNLQTTLDAKRDINPRIQSVASASTVTAVLATDDEVYVTAQAVALTVANPSGTPTNGRKLVYRIKDNGTSRTIAWGAAFRALTYPLPTATTANATLYLAFQYNTADATWDLLSSSNPQVDAGTYTPTATLTLNIAAVPSVGVARWTRVGNIVTVTGRVSIQPTSAGTDCELRLSLPIASTFTNVDQCNGTACGNPVDNTSMVGCILSSPSGTEARILFWAQNTSNRFWTYVYSYEVM